MSEQVNDELEKHDEVVAVAARRADREFRVDLAPTVVEGSSPALARAILNLVDNALKWSPPGTPVEVTVQQGVVSVRDHGPGIAADDLPHVFDPLLPRRRGAHPPRLRARTRDRPADRRGTRGNRHRRASGRRRLALHAPDSAASDPGGSVGRHDCSAETPRAYRFPAAC